MTPERADFQSKWEGPSPVDGETKMFARLVVLAP